MVLFTLNQRVIGAGCCHNTGAAVVLDSAIVDIDAKF